MLVFDLDDFLVDCLIWFDGCVCGLVVDVLY